MVLLGLLSAFPGGACTSSQVNTRPPTATRSNPLILTSPVQARLPREGSFDFSGTASVSVSGRTRPNTQVELLGPDGTTRLVESDGDGLYLIQNVALGTESAFFEMDTGDRVADLGDGANDRRRNVAGTVLPGALVTLSQANTSTTRFVRADPQGAFLFEGVSFDEGPNSFTIGVEAEDAQPTVATFHFTLDTTAPVVEITSLFSGEVVDSSVVSITGELSERNVRIGYRDPENGREIEFLSTARLFDIPFFSLPEGYHAVGLSFTDEVGNESFEVLNFRVDLTSPPLLLRSPRARRSFLSGNYESDAENRLTAIMGFTEPGAVIDALLLSTGDTFSGRADSDGSFVIQPFRDLFGDTVPYVRGEQQVRLKVTDDSGRERQEVLTIFIPTDGELPPPLAVRHPEAESSLSSADFDAARLAAGVLQPSLRLDVETTPFWPYTSVNYALDGRLVDAPAGGERVIRVDPLAAEICLPTDDPPSDSFPEVRFAPLGAEVATDNVVKFVDDPSCSGATPLAGCLSLPDGTPIRIVHVSAIDRTPGAGGCAAGHALFTLDTGGFGGGDFTDLPTPGGTPFWVQTEGIVCNTSIPGFCPSGTDGIGSLVLQPDGTLIADFTGAVDFESARDGYPVRPGDSLRLTIGVLELARNLRVEEVLGPNEIRVERLVNEEVRIATGNFNLRIDRNVSFVVSDTVSDVNGRVVPQNKASLPAGESLARALFPAFGACSGTDCTIEFSDLQGPVALAPLNIPESQQLSFVAGDGVNATRVDPRFRVLSPNRARIVLLRPKAGIVTAADEIAVEGFVLGDTEIDSVEINGRVVGVDARGHFLLYRLPLIEGRENLIQVIARDTNGNVLSIEREILHRGTSVVDVDVTIADVSIPEMSTSTRFDAQGSLSDNADGVGRVLLSGVEGVEFTAACGSTFVDINTTLTPGFDPTLVRLGMGGLNANPSLLYVVDGLAAGTVVEIDDMPLPDRFSFAGGTTLCAPGARMLLIQRNLLEPDPGPGLNGCPAGVGTPCWLTFGRVSDAGDREFFHAFEAIGDFNAGAPIAGELYVELTVAAFQVNQPGAIDTDAISLAVRAEKPFIRPIAPVRFQGMDGILEPQASTLPVCGGADSDAILVSPTNRFAVDRTDGLLAVGPFPQFDDVVIQPGDLVVIGSGQRTTTDAENRLYEVIAVADPVAPAGGTSPADPDPGVFDRHELLLRSLNADLSAAGCEPVSPVSEGLSFAVYPHEEAAGMLGNPVTGDGPAERPQPILTRTREIDVAGYVVPTDAVVTVDGILTTGEPDGTFFLPAMPLTLGPNLIEIVAKDSVDQVSKQTISVFSDPDKPQLSNLCLAFDTSVVGSVGDPCGAASATRAPEPIEISEIDPNAALAIIHTRFAELRGVVDDGSFGSGIRQVEFTINGATVTSFDGFTGANDPFAGTGQFAHPVELEEGANDLRIEITDLAGNTRVLRLTVVADIPDPVPPAASIDCITDVGLVRARAVVPPPPGTPVFCNDPTVISDNIAFSNENNPITPVNLRPGSVLVDDRLIASPRMSVAGRYLSFTGRPPALEIGGRMALQDSFYIPPGQVTAGSAGSTTITVNTDPADLALLQPGDTLVLATSQTVQKANSVLYEIQSVNIPTSEITLNRAMVTDPDGMTVIHEYVFRANNVLLPDEGVNTVLVQAIDLNGRTRIFPLTVVRDTQPPAVAIEGVVSGFQTSIVSPSVLFSDAHLCTDAVRCPEYPLRTLPPITGAGFLSVAGFGVAGAGDQALQIRLARLDEHGESPTAIGAGVIGDPLRYGWAMFSDDVATAGVVDPVNVGYDLENLDAEAPANPFVDPAAPSPAGYPVPDPIAPLLTGGALAVVPLGTAQASSEAAVLSTPLPGDVSCVDADAMAPVPCEAREPLSYRVAVQAWDRVGHASDVQVDFDVVVTPENRVFSGLISLISDNPALIALLSDATELNVLLLDQLSHSGVLYNQNLMLAEILGDFDDPGALARELIASGARDAFATFLGILLDDPDDFGPSPSAVAVLVDVLRILIDRGALDDLLPVLNNRFIIDPCTAAGGPCAGPAVGGDAEAIFTFLAGVLIEERESEKTDLNGDSSFFRTVPGPLARLFPLQREILAYQEAVRRRGSDLEPGFGGNPVQAELTVLPVDGLDFVPLPGIPDSPVNVQAGDILRLAGGPCEGLEIEIANVVDNDTVEVTTAFPAGCTGAAFDYEIYFPNGPALIPTVELFDILLQNEYEPDAVPESSLGDDEPLRSLVHIIEELFNPDPAVTAKLDEDDLEALFNAVFELADDEREDTGTEFFTHLVTEIDLVLEPVATPNAPLDESPRIETLFPGIRSILRGDRLLEITEGAPACQPPAVPASARMGLLERPDWPDLFADPTDNVYVRLRHIDMIQFGAEVHSSPLPSGERSVAGLLPVIREMIDDPDDTARGFTAGGVARPPNSNLNRSPAAELVDPTVRLLNGDVVALLEAFSAVLNPFDNDLGEFSYVGDLTNFDERFDPAATPQADPVEVNAPLLRAFALVGRQRLDGNLDGTDDTSAVRGLLEALRVLVTPIGASGMGENIFPGYPTPEPFDALVNTDICRESFFDGRTPLEVIVPILDQFLEPLPAGAPGVGETPADLIARGEDVYGRDRLTILLHGLFDDPNIDEPEIPDLVDECPTCPAADNVFLETQALEVLPEVLNTLLRFGFDDDDELTSIFEAPTCVVGTSCTVDERLVPAQSLLVDLAMPLDAAFSIGAGGGLLRFEQSLSLQAFNQMAGFDQGEEAANYILLLAEKIAEDIQPLNETTPLPPDVALAPAALRTLADPDGDGDPIPDGIIDDLLPVARMLSRTAVSRQVLDLVRAIRACGVDSADGNTEFRGGALFRALQDFLLSTVPALSGAGAVGGAGDLACPAAGGAGNTGGALDSNPLEPLGQSPSARGVMQGGSRGQRTAANVMFDRAIDFREIGVGPGADLCVIAQFSPAIELCTQVASRPGDVVSVNEVELANNLPDDVDGFLATNCPINGPGADSVAVVNQTVVNFTLSDAPVDESSITITTPVGNFTDVAGDGTLEGPGSEGGFIDYETGEVEIVFVTGPVTGNIDSVYTWTGECSYRIRAMREPYNGCKGGETIELGDTLGSPISAANQSILDFIFRSLYYLGRKVDGFLLENPAAAVTPGMAEPQGRLPRLLDLLTSPVSSRQDGIGGEGAPPLLIDLSGPIELALRRILERYPSSESPPEAMLRLVSEATIDLRGSAAGELPFDLYPSPNVLYQCDVDAAVGDPDECIPAAPVPPVRGNGINDASDMALLALNSVIDQLEREDGINGIARNDQQPALGDDALDPTCPLAGFSDDPQVLLEFGADRLPSIVRNLSPGLQIVLESFDTVSRAGEYDPLYPAGGEPRAQTDALVAGLARISYSGNCRPFAAVADALNCRDLDPNYGALLPVIPAIPPPPPPLPAPPAIPAYVPVGGEALPPTGARGLVFEGLVGDGPVQILAATLDRALDEWSVPPRQPAAHPEGVLHRERIRAQLSRYDNLEQLFFFVRDIIEDKELGTPGEGRVIDPVAPLIIRFGDRRFAGNGVPNSADSESPYDVIFELLYTLIVDPTDCDPANQANGTPFTSRYEDGTAPFGDPDVCRSPLAPGTSGPPIVDAGSIYNAIDAVFRDVGVNLDRPIQPLFGAQLFDRLLAVFDTDPDHPDLIARQLPYTGNMVLGLVQDQASCADAAIPTCTPRILMNRPNDDPFVTYDFDGDQVPDAVLADALFADLQELIPNPASCPPFGSPPFADFPGGWGPLCDPLVSDDLNRNGIVGGVTGAGLCGTDSTDPSCTVLAGNGRLSVNDLFDEVDNDPDGLGLAPDNTVGRPGEIGMLNQDGIVTIYGVDGLDEAFLDGIADLFAADDPAYVVDHGNEGPVPLRNRYTVRAPGAGIAPEALDLIDALGELMLRQELGD